MEFAKKTRTRTIHHKALNIGNDVKTQYPFCVQFYNMPPIEVIRLDEFEEFAIERLKVLRTLEFVGTKHFKFNFQVYRDALNKELTRLNLTYYVRSNYSNSPEKLYEERRRDHISHFILRLAYCRTEELRRWFIQQECDLLRVKLMENNFQLDEVLKHNDMSYTPIEEEVEGLMEIIENTLEEKITLKTLSRIYKVKFTEVLDLVQSGGVYLERGYAFITDQQLVSVIVNAFRQNLSRELSVTARAIPQMEEDGRLLWLLGNINEVYLGKDYNKLEQSKAGVVVPEMLDSLSKSSFPLCMRTLHESLRSNHHLKHGGRMQYGLFIKAIGLKLEDALRFWREEFSKRIGVDAFEKGYAYSIRHNYGKEGNRKNYSSYSCMKIITGSTPAAGEVHGCPFKHMDKGNLTLKLKSLNLTQSAIKDIVELATGGHYQIACTRYFEAAHNNTTLDAAINHPVEYFEESQKIKNGTFVESKNNPRNIKPVSPPIKKDNSSKVVNLSEKDSMDIDMEMLNDDFEFGDDLP